MKRKPASREMMKVLRPARMVMFWIMGPRILVKVGLGPRALPGVKKASRLVVDAWA